jgi:acetyltransferase-like isoleucine patch superfamily enzyme
MIKIIDTAFLFINKFFIKIRLKSIRNSVVDRTSIINSGCNIFNVKVGRYSYFGYDCTVVNSEIGSFCSVASGVTIGAAEHPINFVSTSPIFLSHKDGFKRKFAKYDYLPKKTTKVGSDVWIGNNVMIKSGVNIGHGAIVGMGSVVTKDIPPYAIFAGNPAILIRYRFEEDLRDKLLKSRWWDLSDAELAELGHLFNAPCSFVDEYKSRLS